MTWLDYARHVFGEVGIVWLTDDEVDHILWEFTGFPFARRNRIRQELLDLAPTLMV